MLNLLKEQIFKDYIACSWNNLYRYQIVLASIILCCNCIVNKQMRKYTKEEINAITDKYCQ